MTNPKLDQGPDYERGFIDGMQEQMRRSVKKMVEGKDFTISKPWQGLTEQECIDAIDEYFDFALDHGNVSNTSVVRYARAIESLLKEKNQ